MTTPTKIRSEGPAPNAHSWANDAVLGKGTPAANFNYAGPLTEAVLLGGVATRFPKTTLEWDGPGLKFSNLPAANEFVRRPYRQF